MKILESMLDSEVILELQKSGFRKHSFDDRIILTKTHKVYGEIEIRATYNNAKKEFYITLYAEKLPKSGIRMDVKEGSLQFSEDSDKRIHGPPSTKDPKIADGYILKLGSYFI